jgi:hypothetical protein
MGVIAAFFLGAYLAGKFIFERRNDPGGSAPALSGDH